MCCKKCKSLGFFCKFSSFNHISLLKYHTVLSSFSNSFQRFLRNHVIYLNINKNVTVDISWCFRTQWGHLYVHAKSSFGTSRYRLKRPPTILICRILMELILFLWCSCWKREKEAEKCIRTEFDRASFLAIVSPLSWFDLFNSQKKKNSLIIQVLCLHSNSSQNQSGYSALFQLRNMALYLEVLFQGKLKVSVWLHKSYKH